MKTRNEIIEALKTNRVPYYLWADEERAVADGIKREWWLCSTEDEQNFDALGEGRELGENASGFAVYRLKPEYQDVPESLWIESEITISAGSYDGVIPGLGKASLHMLQSFVGFGGIMYEDCACWLRDLRDGDWDKSFRMQPPPPCEKHGPHKPLKVRFWRGK